MVDELALSDEYTPTLATTMWRLITLEEWSEESGHLTQSDISIRVCRELGSKLKIKDRTK
jgi:hypothetical protein